MLKRPFGERPPPHHEALSNRLSAFLVTFVFPLGVLLISLASHPVYAGPVEVVDDTGAQVHLPAPAQRIVSLSPHATELLFAAGAGDAVVAVPEYSNYPAEATTRPLVGNSSNVNLETIVSLRPDLIVAWKSGNTSGQIEQLMRLGLTVFFSEPRRLEDIPSNLERLGQLAGTQAQAGKAAMHFREELAALRDTYAGQAPLRVFYEIWPRPLMTINGQHMISQIITLCGGVNIFEDLPTLAPTVSFEAVLQKNPDVIISASSAEPEADWYRKWLDWPQISAVRQHQFYSIEPDTIQRQTPRILEGTRQICADLTLARHSLRTVPLP